MFSRKQKYLVIVPVFFLLADLVFAQAGVQWFQVTKGNQNNLSVTINKHSVCKGVKNKSTTNDIFIPVNTAAEWTSFLSNALSSVVDFGNCLANNAHDIYDCPAAGGTLVGSSPNQFCKFNLSGCPTGWTKYANWTKTKPETCSDVCGKNGTSCTTGSHAWVKNLARETCTYQGSGGLVPFVCGGTKTCYANITQVGCY